MSQALIAEAVLGRDAEEFLTSDLGRYLVGRAQIEADEAMAKLKKVSPTASQEIISLQHQIWRAEQFATWLQELIANGRAAEQTLEELSTGD